MLYTSTIFPLHEITHLACQKLLINMRYNWLKLGKGIIFIAIYYTYFLINIISKPLMPIRIILSFIDKSSVIIFLCSAPCLFLFKRSTRSHPLLNIAKLNIKPLESSKLKLQVLIATETINTKKGGKD